VKELQGKKDVAGDYARIIVAGFNLGHLQKTLLVYLREMLTASKTPFTENKKDNYFRIGTVTVMLVTLENPQGILGFDVCVAKGTKIVCKRKGRVKEITIERVLESDQVLTRGGWRGVKALHYNGVKPVIRVAHPLGDTWCTADHKVLSDGQWKEAGALKIGDQIETVDVRKVKKWENLLRLFEQVREDVYCLTEPGFTGIPAKKQEARILQAFQKAVSAFFYTLPFGKTVSESSRTVTLSIISTVTHLTTALKILEQCRGQSIPKSTIWKCGITMITAKSVLQALEPQSGDGSIGSAIKHVLCAGRILLASLVLRSFARILVRTEQVRNLVWNRLKCSAELAGLDVPQSSQGKLNSVARSALTDLDILLEKLRCSETEKNGRVRYVGASSRPLRSLLRLRALPGVKTLGGDKLSEVYDLTVDGNDHHEFVANGAVCHNCSVVVDEIDELPEDKAIEAVRALTERARQKITGFRKPFLAFASTSQGQKGLYRIYNHFKKTGTGFVLMRARTADNLFLDRAYVRDLARMYTPEERRVFLEGEFISIAKGRVLPDFTWEKSYLEYDLDGDLPANTLVFISQDFNTGYNRASAYTVRDKVIYCIKDYDFPNVMDAPAVFRHDFPNQKIFWIPDVTSKDLFPQFSRELRKHDIHIIFRSKNPLVEDTVFLVNKLFYLQRLYICRIAKNLAEACSLFMRDKDNKIPKGVGRNDPAHYVDGLRYACAFICQFDPGFLDVRKAIVERRVSLRDGASPPMVTNLGGGYSDISPEALKGAQEL
jgi:hypothetical protein